MRTLTLAAVAFVLVGCGSDDGENERTSSAPGRGTVLVENERLVLELGVDGEHVFWVSDNLLRKLPVAGGTPIDVGTSVGESLELDATHAYFAGGIRGTIAKLEKAGGAAVTIVTGEANPTSLAVDSSGVYWANWSSYDTAPVADGSVVSAGLDGSNVATLAENLIYARGLALDADNVYWVSASEETLYRLPKAGGTPVALASGLYDPGSPVLDESGIYVRTRNRPDDLQGEDAIVRVDPTGGGAEIIVSERYGISSIDVHDGFVYYTRSGGSASCERRSGVVRRLPTAGGTPTDVAVEQSAPALIAVDATGVYWTNGSSSTHPCKTLVKAELP